MNAPETLRLPPHSIESEQSVLGGLLLDNSAYDRVAGLLTDADFYRDDHRRIFAHIRRLITAGKTADVVTVFASIEQSNEVDQTGGMGYLGEIANATPSAAAVGRYAKIIADRAKRRRLIAAADMIANEAFTSADPVEKLMDEAEAKIYALAGTCVGESEPKAIGAVLGPVVDRIQDLYDREDSGVSGLASGFPDIDAMTNGFQNGDLIILAGRPSMGKAQPLTSRVLMQDGRWKEIGCLMFGDRIASIDGNDSRVIGIYPQGRKPIFRVTLSDGRSARCCADHLWTVDSSRWEGGPRVLPAAELIRLLETERYRSRITVPLISGEFGFDDGLSINPWLLGVLLANGSCGTNRVTVSTPDAATLFRIQQIVGIDRVVMCGNYDYRINHGGDADSVLGEIKRMGLAGLHCHEKFIPEQYMRASKKSRLELLRGLLDTDGWVEKFGSVRIALSNLRLAEQVRELVWSVGGKCSISSKDPEYTHCGEKKAGLTSYVLNIQHQDRASLLTLARKKNRCKEDGRFRLPTISSIEQDGEEEAICIKVSHPSELYVTDGYTVTHNTAFAINVAENVALDGKAVLVFSLEMSDEQLVQRTLASIGSINSRALRSGRLNDDDWNRMTAALGKLHEAPLYIDETPSISVSQMAAKARRLAKKVGRLGLIVIDYLQLMEAEGQNRNDELGIITRRLKLMAKDLDCPVICLSQLSRKVEERGDKRPILSDLRESGAIEQDADVVAMMFRDDYYREDSAWKGMAEFIIRKQRMGETGTVHLVFRKEYSRFGSASSDCLDQCRQNEKASRPARGGFRDE